MKWTADQQRVIETRNCNLLVSAAAGSGKTAVLVERILQRLTDSEAPLSLDRLLVMTFTRAAAEEMRERIGKALKERISADGENQRLRLQRAILPRARIATIDSICQGLIKQNYQALDIDPGFRVADEGELKLMRADVLQEILEEAYAQGDEAFQRFAETYGAGRFDTKVSELIEQCYDFVQANPWPELYLKEQRESCTREMAGGFETSAWFSALLSDLRESASEFLSQLSEAKLLAEEPDGPAPYLPMIEELIAAAETLGALESYEAIYRFLRAFETGRLGAVRGAKYDPEKKNAAKDVIDRFRNYLKKELQPNYGLMEPELVREANAGAAAHAVKLIELTEAFMQRFSEKKREKNIVDFSDIEHFCLQLLYRRETAEDGTERMVYSELAASLSAQFDEILIDEYQDSNMVQEALLAALSGERFGRPDVFMVGDVKQSIYRFRLARPELFLEKYARYGAEGTDVKIELSQNFRSRKEVVDSVNAVFRPMMQPAVGGVQYDARAALRAAADYPETGDGGTELCLIDMAGSENLSDEAAEDESAETAESYAAEECEAVYIAQRIAMLVNRREPEKSARVYDAKRGALRPAAYRDIAILLRAPGGRAEKLVDVLARAGIPAYYENASGYFDAAEVETVLAVLNIIDNPHQDIALAAVLLSPIGGFTEDELARLRAASTEKQTEAPDAVRDLYAALCYGGKEAAEAHGIDRALREKCAEFLAFLERYRDLSALLPVHALLSRLYAESGYYHHVGASPLGKLRMKNLDMLMQKAESYAATSYQGLFHFVRYIEMLRKYQTDYGEASAVTEQDDIVRITSIHKSKGLEYPIVFLANAGKGFNARELAEKMMFDSELGIAGEYIDLARRVRYPSLKKAVMKRKRKIENYGEELRVLYVAMTRAKEKLIITAAVRSAEKLLGRFETAVDAEAERKAAAADARAAQFVSNEHAARGKAAGHPDGDEKMEEGRADALFAEETMRKLPCSKVLEAGSYLDWILMSGAVNDAIGLRVLGTDTLKDAAADEVIAAHASGARFEDIPREMVYDAALAKKLRLILETRYGYEEETRLRPKLTVSQLKEARESVGKLRTGGVGGETPAADGALRSARGMQNTASEEYAAKAERDRAAIQRTAEMAEVSEPDYDDGAYEQEQILERLTDAFAGFAEGETKHLSAAGRGTLYHRFMQLLDFSRFGEKCLRGRQSPAEFAGEELLRMRAAALLPEAEKADDAKLLSETAAFLETPLAARMADAAERNALFREQHFMIGLPARELSPDTNSEELQLLQGIIDAYTEEPDGSLLLIDYKTDRVRDEEVLRARYGQQLYYYAKALRQLTAREVSDCLIYSTALGRSISVSEKAGDVNTEVR